VKGNRSWALDAIEDAIEMRLENVNGYWNGTGDENHADNFSMRMVRLILQRQGE
jgi:hypothetical protein